jgi:CheY-like chemotaxis protein
MPDKPLIFLIDDDYINHVITQNILELHLPDVTIESFTAAKKVLNLIKNGTKPNMILLDLIMPVMNGWEFLDELLKLDESINIFVLTFSIQDKDLQTSRNYPNIKGFFTKPINQKNINHILQYLDRPDKAAIAPVANKKTVQDREKPSDIPKVGE